MARPAHKHTPLKVAALAGAARDALVAGGEQWTDMREKVFAILAEAGQPLSAYEVAERLGRVMGRRVAANSVYRILDLFVAGNLALRVESRNAFLVNVHPGCVHDCIFLICRGCGRTEHMDDDDTAGTVRLAAAGAGFRPDRPIIEVLGLCGQCSS